jgi:hypothetical protein
VPILVAVAAGSLSGAARLATTLGSPFTPEERKITPRVKLSQVRLFSQSPRRHDCVEMIEVCAPLPRFWAKDYIHNFVNTYPRSRPRPNPAAASPIEGVVLSGAG